MSSTSSNFRIQYGNWNGSWRNSWFDSLGLWAFWLLSLWDFGTLVIGNFFKMGRSEVWKKGEDSKLLLLNVPFKISLPWSLYFYFRGIWDNALPILPTNWERSIAMERIKVALETWEGCKHKWAIKKNVVGVGDDDDILKHISYKR